MRIIDKLNKKIKEVLATSWIDEVMWVAIIMFVGLGSFSLGMIHERKQYLEQNPVEVSYSTEALLLWEAYQNINQQDQNFFASKSGSIVYPAGCTKGDRVKEENRVFFTSAEQAVNEGYRLVEGC